MQVYIYNLLLNYNESCKRIFPPTVHFGYPLYPSVKNKGTISNRRTVRLKETGINNTYLWNLFSATNGTKNVNMANSRLKTRMK